MAPQVPQGRKRWHLLLLSLILAPAACIAGDPPCPLDMNSVLPSAEYSGPLKCQLGGGSSQESGGKCENLAGKVAVVTGASTGLGYGIAARLHAAGMKVIGTSRNPELYTGNCVYTKPGDRCKPGGWQLWQLDQTSDESVNKFIQQVKDAYGHIDLLYLNAGRGYGSNTFRGSCNDISQQQLLMDTNFWGPVRMIIAALPIIPKTGYARIMLTASTATWVSIQGNLPYAASKASVAAIGEEWLYEYYGDRAGNIKFIQIHPGSMLTDLARKSIPGCKAQSDPSTGALDKKDWEKWEQWQFTGPKAVYITPAQGGEAIYRVAIDPNPKKRYLLNNERSIGFIKKRICTHLSAPMEQWPKAYD
eukprot:GHUV01000600.1.p1 GENE.GHUV01000600.1~~GHUV01000600.1.p1  ORF type:complete len:361 (+),score=75.59 GHUV01000600.1:265-1347(+)